MFQVFSTSRVLAKRCVLRSSGALCVVVLATCALGGICEPQWNQGVGQPGLDGWTQALTVHNGEVYAGGQFETSGGQTVNRIARWDGSAWQPLVSAGGEVGVSFHVHALATYDGELIAGGNFGTAGGQTVNRIARWDGSAWHPLESGGEIGVNDNVFALTVHNGDLVVGGNFNTAGGLTVNNIARWDGSAWHPLEAGGQIGVSGGDVRALASYNEDLIAGGSFTTAGGQTVNRIARWDGSAWHPFESGGQIGIPHFAASLRDFAVHNGDLVVVGAFTTAGGQTLNNIARWDGSDWHPLESGGHVGVGGPVFALTVHGGDLCVGGNFTTAGGEPANHVATWHLPQWKTALGQPGMSLAGLPSVNSVLSHNGVLFATGEFTEAGAHTVNHIARWNDASQQWHPLELVGQVGFAGDAPYGWALTTFQGDLIAGGRFVTAGGQAVNNIARWDTLSGVWQPFISAGHIGIDGHIFALTVYKGDLIVGGLFESAGGQTVNNIARWDGVAGGWKPFEAHGQIGVNNQVRVLMEHNGDLIVGKLFTTAGGIVVNRIARWDDGSAEWSAFRSVDDGIGVNSGVFALEVYDGDLTVGGAFATAGNQTVNRIARWEDLSGRESGGASGGGPTGAWHPFVAPNGQVGVSGGVNDLTTYNGHVVAGGWFEAAGGETVNRIARWVEGSNGGEWQPFASGLGIGLNNQVRGLTIHDGNLIIGGDFTTAGAKQANYIVGWTDCLPCPGDLTGSGAVGVWDLLALIGCWGPVMPGCESADLTGSGSIGVFDLLELLGQWGPCP